MVPTKNRLIIATLLFILAAASPLQAQAPVEGRQIFAVGYAVKSLTANEARADIALMRRALETIHPGLYRYSSREEIDAAFVRLNAAAAKPLTDLELYRQVALMLAQIHCDHTKAEPSEAMERFREVSPTHLPLRFSIIEGRMIVISNDGQAGAPPPGAEITTINGVPTPVVLTTLGGAVAYDGATDPAIGTKLAADGDLMGDDFDEYYPAFYGFPSTWRLDWKPVGAAAIRDVELSPIAFKAWTKLPWSGAPYRDEFYKAIGWRVAGKAALLRIGTFVNYRNPVDATAFLDGFFKTLKGEGVDHLILDLRDNGGGSEDVSVALGRYLLPERFTLVKTRAVEGHSLWRPAGPHVELR